MNNYEKLSPEARKEVDAEIWLINRNIVPLLPEQQEALKDSLAKLVLSCYAAEGIDAWRRMYYDLTRRFEGENLTEKQIAEKAQTHREYMFQEGMLRV
jgi:hypothetical protein